MIALYEDARRLATVDTLTGLLNRRAFLDALERESARSERHAYPLSVLLLDVDHFKRVNDTYGHAAGDAVLQGFARVLSSVARRSDVVGRWGGEEFVVALPQTGAAGARVAAERVRRALAEARYPIPGGDPLRMTASVGAATSSRPGPRKPSSAPPTRRCTRPRLAVGTGSSSPGPGALEAVRARANIPNLRGLAPPRSSPRSPHGDVTLSWPPAESEYRLGPAMAKKSKSGKSGNKPRDRRERRFEPETGARPGLVYVLGAVGALAMGAGAWEEGWGRSSPRAVPSRSRPVATSSPPGRCLSASPSGSARAASPSCASATAASASRRAAFAGCPGTRSSASSGADGAVRVTGTDDAGHQGDRRRRRWRSAPGGRVDRP